MRLLLSFALAASCVALPAAAAKVNSVSWGKPGVTMEQYRQDAVDCGSAAYYADVSGTQAAQVFKRASQQLENNEANLYTLSGTWGYTPIQLIARSEQIIHGTRPTARFREIRELQGRVLSSCLTSRGYRQFSLTKAQQDYVRRLKIGSAERHAYLYGLSIDAQVLHTQAI